MLPVNWPDLGVLGREQRWSTWGTGLEVSSHIASSVAPGHDQGVARGCGALQEFDVAAVQHIEAAADHHSAGYVPY